MPEGGLKCEYVHTPMATAKPSRTRKPVTGKPITPAQHRQRQHQIAEERTKRLAQSAYDRAYRHAQVALARQQAKSDALRDAGIKPQEQQQQPKQKPLAKAPKSGRKPQNRKPPKR